MILSPERKQYTMKKLLILGGSRYVIPVIRKAHEMGVYVITCDYLPDNIGHQYADEYGGKFIGRIR